MTIDKLKNVKSARDWTVLIDFNQDLSLSSLTSKTQIRCHYIHRRISTITLSLGKKNVFPIQVIGKYIFWCP